MTNEKHEQIKLTPALDAKITTYMQTSDELDSSDFSPIEYSNLIFPTFESLENIDFVISNLKNEVSRIDQSILLQIQQNNSIDKLSSVKQSILGLSTQISRIKENALQSEVMVHEITRDIKSLDTAKRNLSNSVQLLKRLELIVNSIEQLKAYSSKKQYIETAQLLYAAKQVLNNFTTSRNIKQVTNLFDKMTNLETDLKRQVFAEFDAGFLGGVLRVQSSFLKDACLVVDVMELDAQKALVDWYCELQLRDYKANFRNNYEVGGLADVARRFAWLKRLLKLFDEEHSAAFLSHWNVAEYLCEKRDLSDVLSKLDVARNIDVTVMLKSFSNTMEFEGKLEQRFGKSQEQDASSKFYKIISSCFAPYLDHYIDSENRSLGEMMEKYKSTPISTNITAGSDDEGLIPSSTDLFYSYRQTMIQFARFSTGKPFLDLSRMFGKWLREYANYLTLKLPRDDRRSFSDEDIRLVCFIINTADYCGNTITQLEEKISEKINAQFKNLVNMNNEREEFIGIIGNSIKILVRGVINCIDPALYNMTRLSWSAVESVGDQSDYVSNIASQLMAQGAVVKATLSGTKFYRTFCDKLADEFLAKFDGNIYKCKPVGEVGAEQMLLDTHALRTLLVQVSAIGTDRHTQPPAIYLKILQKGVSKVEMLLKTIMIPSEPADGLIDRYMMMYAGEVSVTGFQKILEIKGMTRRVDQQLMIDLLQQKLVTSAPEQVPSGTVNTNAGKSNAGTATGLKMKDDFSKYFSFKK